MLEEASIATAVTILDEATGGGSTKSFVVEPETRARFVKPIPLVGG